MTSERTDPTLTADAVKAHALKLAPLLQEAGLTVAMRRGAIVEVRNPRDERMKQLIALRQRDDGPWWAWVWPGPTLNADPELEPMVPAGYLDEAARRITRILHVDEAEQ